METKRVVTAGSWSNVDNTDALFDLVIRPSYRVCPVPDRTSATSIASSVDVQYEKTALEQLVAEGSIES